MRKQLFFLLLALAAVLPARAQFIGYTAPQTVQQSLATNVACTGAVQNFPINNLGQVTHILAVSSTGVATTSFQAVLQGTTDAVTYFNLSDTVNGTGSASHPLLVSAQGYYPLVRAQVVCTPVTGLSTFSLVYTGVAGAANNLSGANLSSQIWKQLANGASAGSSVNYPTGTTQLTPFGSTSGEITFVYNGAGPAGSSLNVFCFTSGGTSTPVGTFALATTTTVYQTFAVTALPCPQFEVSYTAGGASASTYSLDYVFTVPGLPPPASVSIGAVTQGTSPWVVSGTVNQGTLNLASAILSGQQAVTNADVALASNVLTHGICVSALSTNAASIFIGTTGVTISTGLELPAKASTCLAVSNSSAVHVIAAAGGSSVTWVGN